MARHVILCQFVLEFTCEWKRLLLDTIENAYTRPLRMRRITQPVSMGQKIDYIFGMPDPNICLFTVQLLLVYDDD